MTRSTLSLKDVQLRRESREEAQSMSQSAAEGGRDERLSFCLLTVFPRVKSGIFSNNVARNRNFNRTGYNYQNF